MPSRLEEKQGDWNSQNKVSNEGIGESRELQGQASYGLKGQCADMGFSPSEDFGRSMT